MAAFAAEIEARATRVFSELEQGEAADTTARETAIETRAALAFEALAEAERARMQVEDARSI